MTYSGPSETPLSEIRRSMAEDVESEQGSASANERYESFMFSDLLNGDVSLWQQRSSYGGLGGSGVGKEKVEQVVNPTLSLVVLQREIHADDVFTHQVRSTTKEYRSCTRNLAFVECCFEWLWYDTPLCCVTSIAATIMIEAEG